MKDGNRIFCEKCGFEIQRLTEAEAQADIPGHGWCNWKTALQWICYECADKIFERSSNPWPEILYECYIADRIHPEVHENQMALEGIPARLVEVVIPRRRIEHAGMMVVKEM